MKLKNKFNNYCNTIITKVEIKEFIAIMTIDCENSDLIRLSNLYDIDWKITNAFKDKNIKNITIRDYNKYRNDNK